MIIHVTLKGMVSKPMSKLLMRLLTVSKNWFLMSNYCGWVSIGFNLGSTAACGLPLGFLVCQQNYYGKVFAARIFLTWRTATIEAVAAIVNRWPGKS